MRPPGHPSSQSATPLNPTPKIYLETKSFLFPSSSPESDYLSKGGSIFLSDKVDVTVVDTSQRMLDVDRQLADRWGLPIATCRASMDDLSSLEHASLDAVVQPVSSCYVPDVIPVYRQVARVLRTGGIYTVQHKQPASMHSLSDPFAALDLNGRSG